ncbi:7224_t:CDS:1, partial [Gigaspora rosea]
RRLCFSSGERLKDSVITKGAISTKAKDTGLIFKDITYIMSEEVADIIPKGTADITFEKAVGVASKRAENTILEKVADTKKAENAILEEIAATKGAENAILEEVADKTTK